MDLKKLRLPLFVALLLLAALLGPSLDGTKGTGSAVNSVSLQQKGADLLWQSVAHQLGSNIGM